MKWIYRVGPGGIARRALTKRPDLESPGRFFLGGRGGDICTFGGKGNSWVEMYSLRAVTCKGKRLAREWRGTLDNCGAGGLLAQL